MKLRNWGPPGHLWHW